MKTVAALVLPVIATIAFGSNAPQNVRQDVNRLTLLPGPFLTSPARGAPQPTAALPAAEGMIPMRAEQPQFRFVPAPKPSAATPAKLQLSSEADKPKEFAPPRKPQPPRDPDSLKFDSKLQPVTPSLLQRKS